MSSDLRDVVPPGPPPLVPGLPDDELAERKAARKRHRAEVIAQGMPPGVWMVRPKDTYAVLRVLAPGVVELWPGGAQPVERLTVTKVVRGWWRGSRLTLVTPDGGKRVLWATNTDVCLADVGEAEHGRWKEVASGATDGLGLVLLLLFLIFGWPWLLVRTLRRRRARNALADAIDGR